MSDDRRLMLRSREGRRYTEIDAPKVRRGHFLTRGDGWLAPQVRAFIDAAPVRSVLDPFAGEGHLLEQVRGAGVARARRGLDLHSPLWPANDSLVRIPPDDDTLILTNPPYLARHSAARKGVYADLEHYFAGTAHRDLYLLALERCLDAAPYVVTIVPETFIHTGAHRSRLVSVTVLEGAPPFDDTTVPACVACFGPGAVDDSRVYVDAREVGALSALDALRRVRPPREPRVRFNDPAGALALRAVDGTSAGDRIRFMPAEECDYDASRLKVSSRLVTYLSIAHGATPTDVAAFADALNARLAALRDGIGDLALSPFKGNDQAGRRRRRLDYRQARALVCDVLTEAGPAKATTGIEPVYTALQAAA